jgi:hypothetical protein
VGLLGAKTKIPVNCAASKREAMKLLRRLFITAMAAVAAGAFVLICAMFVPYSSFTSSTSFRLVQAVAIWGCAAVVALYAWRHTASVTLGLVGCILLGAVVVGGIGLAVPIILGSGGQGALFGIFVSGPLGVIAGGAGGAMYWRAHSPDEATSDD